MSMRGGDDIGTDEPQGGDQALRRGGATRVHFEDGRPTGGDRGPAQAEQQAPPRASPPSVAVDAEAPPQPPRPPTPPLFGGEQDAQASARSRPSPSVRRPPPPLTAANIAAMVRAGCQSAGLAWLQQATASAATATEQDQANTGAPQAQRAREREERGRALADVPMIGEPPRHAREITLPVPEGFEWPVFEFIALYEHSGEEREANAEILGAPTCSVADRRSVRPPSERAWHVLAKVRDFLMAYPHPIRRQSNHITCGHANWGSWDTWPAKILNGSMQGAAEEMLYINCIGDRSSGEQPPTAHQHTLGPPTQVTNGHQHGAPSKTYYKWLRNLPRVPASDEVPPAERWSELAVSGTPEEKTVKRSYTPRNLAVAEARAHAHASGGDAADFGRPASEPCKQYREWRSQLVHNFGIFAAWYAPTVTAAWVMATTRENALFLVPITHTTYGPCAMINLEAPEKLFGAPRDAGLAGADQGERAAAFISGGLPTQYAAPWQHDGHDDAVVMVPWPRTPALVVRSVEQREWVLAAGQHAAWCTLDALADRSVTMPVLLAFQRVAAMCKAGAHGLQRPGTWTAARPLVHFRTARAWADSADHRESENAKAREEFLAQERERGIELRASIAALDEGDGDLVALADSVKTAADLQAELPFPANGLPTFDDERLRLHPFIERPLNLDTSWLARLPPQQVPPGFRPLPWQGILRKWARRECCRSLNATADRDFECWDEGASQRRRPAFLCLGPGAAHQIAHADGIGSYNALSIVYEQDPVTGLFDKLDYEREGRTKWVLEMIRQVFGIHTDRQLMSLIMHGVRWGIDAPMQIRIAANLERMDSRIRGVGAAFVKLLEAGRYYKFKKLRRRHERIDPDGPAPFIIIPEYIVGSGGTDKTDNPSEKRIIGDQTTPHAEQAVRERNKPHGPPDGPIAVSVNDMMGPTPGTVPRGQMLDEKRYPMPHPEVKTRPRHVYNDKAVMAHMAFVSGHYLAGVKDDGRHMFYQFVMHSSEERTCAFVLLVEIDGEVWFVLIIATCMNMGSRNASKVAQRFTDRLLEGFSQQLDKYVEHVWLPKQKPEFQQLIAERRQQLGPRQARPFSTSGYTDDYEMVFLGPELTAVGAMLWRRIGKVTGFELSQKSGAGTVIDYIGGRLVLNGGFGCMPPSKQARAIHDTQEAIAGTIDRETLESHNSFLVHVHDWLDFPQGTLKGLSAPLRIPGTGEQRATIDESVREQFRRILELLQTRQAASFWSGIDEADAKRLLGIVGSEGVIFAPRFASDSCSDVENPYICGVAAGLFWRFELSGRWRRKHITLTEACGTILCALIFPVHFPNQQLMIEGDATAGLAAAEATAAAKDLIYLRRRAGEIPSFREALLRTWCTHCKGWANGLSDAGSRDKLDVMFGLAAAFGMRLREVPIPQEALDFMADVLVNTADAHAEQDGATSRGVHNPNMTGDMPIAHMAEQEVEVDEVEVQIDEIGVQILDWFFGPGGYIQVERTWLGTDVIAELGSQVILPQFVYPEGWRVDSHVLQPDEPDVEPSDSDVEGDYEHDVEHSFSGPSGSDIRSHVHASSNRHASVRSQTESGGSAGAAGNRHLTKVERGLGVCPSCVDYDGAAPSASESAANGSDGRDWPWPCGTRHLCCHKLVMCMHEPPRCAAWQCSRHELAGCACGAGERCGCAGPPPPPPPPPSPLSTVEATLPPRARARAGPPRTKGTRRWIDPARWVLKVRRPSGLAPVRHLPHVQREVARLKAARAAASTGRARSDAKRAGERAPPNEQEPGDGGGERAPRASTTYAPHAARKSAPASKRPPPRALKHRTARGKRNLNMTGDMPIAHDTVASLVDALRDAVARSEGDGTVTHHAFALAAALGTARPKRSTKNALVACVMLLQRPPRYRSLEEAARAHKASVSSLRSWRQTLTSALEAEAHARATPRASASGSDAPGGARAEPSARSNSNPNPNPNSNSNSNSRSRQQSEQREGADGRQPDEVSAAHGLLSMGAESDAGAQPSRPRSCDPAAPGGDAIRFPGMGALEPSPAGLAGGRRPTGSSARASRRQDASGRLLAAVLANATPDLAPADRNSARRALAQRAFAQQGGSPTPPAMPRFATRGSPRVAIGRASTEAIDDEILDMTRAESLARRSSSPQPSTARQARRQAARQIAQQLAHDESQYALCPEQSEALESLVVSAAEARDAGIPHGTASADEWGFAWVKKFAAATGNVWMRPRVDAVTTARDRLREAYFTALALMWIAAAMPASARRRRAGYEQGMPTSALLAIYAFRRVQRDCARYLPGMEEARGVLKGLCARYKLRWGDDALVPMRKQPFSTAHTRAILHALDTATVALGWTTCLAQAMQVAFCFGMSTGMRKDEWTAAFNDDTYLRRANLTWVDDDGEPLPSTPEVTASRRNGHLLRGRAPPSKCDRLATEWGARYMWFRLDDSNPLNFAARWRQWELDHPCPPQDRGTWPAFSPFGNEVPFTSSRAGALFQALLVVAIGALAAALRSWHSCRITIATRLYARRGTSDVGRDEVEGVIQAVVRWKTVEAMRIYARIEPAHYARYVDMAASLEGESGETIPDTMPPVDPEAMVEEGAAAIAAIDEETRAAANARRAEAKRRASANAEPNKKRRQAAPSGQPRDDAPEHSAAPVTVEIDGGVAVSCSAGDSWGATGQTLRMHNSFWGWDDGGFSTCKVIGYAGLFDFPDGRQSKHTYVIECDGFHYPARHTAVAGALADAAVKRRVRKAGPPKAL